MGEPGIRLIVEASEVREAERMVRMGKRDEGTSVPGPGEVWPGEPGALRCGIEGEDMVEIGDEADLNASMKENGLLILQ